MLRSVSNPIPILKNKGPSIDAGPEARSPGRTRPGPRACRSGAPG